ncbi:MAG TPA: LuxR C-terminal-related transcriptional regulator [Bryobacteraceae bacterium]|nr:LuxR C-terminal-related transcriptional regulator [Bryobacteraceae bacterium]
MLRLEDLWDRRHRTPVLIVSGVSVLVLAIADWWTKSYISLGFLYLFPILLSAGILPRWAIVSLAVVCAVLSEIFSALEPTGSYIRMAFETLAFAGSGLLVAEMVRNRRLTSEAQERLRILVETSPAAIVTIDENGFIQLANRAATELIAPRDGHLVGHPVAAFLPELHHALRREEGPQFRTSMQCRGQRDNGEAFMADVWFSTYNEGSSPRLAAIIADVSEEGSASPSNHSTSTDGHERILTARETDVLRYLVQGLANKEIAANMEISESTVKNTLQQLFAKTGVRTRSQLVRVALEQYRNLL